MGVSSYPGAQSAYAQVNHHHQGLNARSGLTAGGLGQQQQDCLDYEAKFQVL